MLGAFSIGLLIPANRRGQETAERVKCANNLRQIGLACMLYCNENRGSLPRTKFAGGATIIPDVTNGGFDSRDPFKSNSKVPANCVPSALFLLLRTEDINVGVMNCPSSAATPDNFGGGDRSIPDRSNFSYLKKNLSYSLANPYPDDGAVAKKYRWAISALPVGFALAADLNPGNAGGSDVLSVTPNSLSAEMRKANSKNHGGDGQNILFADVHVEFDINPFVGAGHDNIYCRGMGGPDAAKEDIVNSPTGQGDSVLLPAATE
jgi:hypothetical protein